MFGLDIATVSGFLILAGNVQCTVPKAPHISINPQTYEIQYEVDKTSEELDAIRLSNGAGDSASVDVTTGGLRHDSPELSIRVQWGIRKYPDLELACLWYDKIDVDINLRPKIYISRDFKTKTCREAIWRHELKHVDVDRYVMNNYARAIGRAVQQVVNDAGAMGPYKFSDLDAVQDTLSQKVQNAVKAQEKAMSAEMKRRQGKVDTPEEYKRVSEICRKAEAK